MRDVFVTMFGGSKLNVSERARREKFTITPGWKLFCKQHTCVHTLTVLHTGLTSSVEVCSKCGIAYIDVGNPEM